MSHGGVVSRDVALTHVRGADDSPRRPADGVATGPTPGRTEGDREGNPEGDTKATPPFEPNAGMPTARPIMMPTGHAQRLGLVFSVPGLAMRRCYSALPLPRPRRLPSATAATYVRSGKAQPVAGLLDPPADPVGAAAGRQPSGLVEQLTGGFPIAAARRQVRQTDQVRRHARGEGQLPA